MKGHSRLSIVAAMLLMLAAPGFALAGDKNNAAPKSNSSLSYGKIEYTYAPQKDARKTSGTKGKKVQMHELSVQKRIDKASP